MNKYKQEMINDRELIYDAKQQLRKADEKYKSGINMAGTSMGSYDKPMMKGSYDKPMMGGYDKPMMKGGYDKPMMKAGCQISKHMGGRGAAMMGKKSCK